MMNYKGYSAQVTYDDEAEIFHGEIFGIKDVVTFQGSNVSELKRAFQDSVDEYLAFCEERNETPDKPYSGRFNLRISPELHATLSWMAQVHDMSLNAYITLLLEKEVA